ncbi:MAG TPA: ATP-binding protein, partial [Elusimicrobiota bacterium]|nr:ATP-binding protein [Elusimicrobiota bacterium]
PRTRESLALGESLESVDAGLATKSGRVIPVLCSASAFRDQDGEVDGFLIGVKDIAERKIAEEALSRQAMDLMRSNVELEQFAYVASHDLQEPLRKILLFSERLRGGAQRLEPAARDSLARIESSAQRMRHLIDAILRLSKVMRGQVVVEPVALDAVAREALADLEERLAETGGAVEVGPLPRMRVDAEQMRQLFQNLLSNALKFRRPEEAPRIAISSRKLAGGLVEIAVADNGIGFEEKYLDRIFKPFQRLHPMGVYEGSGIGLSICQKIVERHGGMITARSAPGKGTTFLITLPGRQKE